MSAGNRVIGRAELYMERSAAVALLMAAVACSSAPPPEVLPDPTPVVEIPAGVDSSVAVYADSVAAVSFVEVEQQEEATALQEEGRALVAQSDSLWEAQEVVDSPVVVSAEDSAEALVAAANGGRALVELDSLLRDEDVDGVELARMTALLLDSAQAALETAYELNPFDARSKLWLARVYELQARRLGQAEAYRRAIEELEKLAVLTPDQHTVFAMLANNHYRLAEWGLAADHYQRAEDVYLETYDLTPEVAGSLDSAQVFGYVRAQADVHVLRLDAADAAAAFDRAMRFAPTSEDTAYVAGELEWMAWDDMNIASSFARDSIGALERDGDLDGARAGYTQLLPTLTAQTAIDEIDWRIAIVDYNLDRAEDAAERLQALVARTVTDADGIPRDSAYVQYFDDYGTVCLNLGRESLHERRDNRTALKYFTQATRVRWQGQAVAYLEVASLVQGNFESALESATHALGMVDLLTIDQQRDLYRLLMGLYRRSGDFERAREYRDAYRALPER